MNTLAKEFETTCQLPPSTPQQRMTPPTVLLPATFTILPPQSAALSAAMAATGGGGGLMSPLGSSSPAFAAAVSHPSLSAHMLGHTVVTAAASTNAASCPSGGNALASANSCPLFLLGASSPPSFPHAAGGAAADERASPVSATVLAPFAHAFVGADGDAGGTAGGRDAGRDRLSASLRLRRPNTHLTIRVPSPCTANAAITIALSDAAVSPTDDEEAPPQRLPSASPVESGSRPSHSAEGDACTPASSTDSTDRSGSVFDGPLAAATTTGSAAPASALTCGDGVITFAESAQRATPSAPLSSSTRSVGEDSTIKKNSGGGGGASAFHSAQPCAGRTTTLLAGQSSSMPPLTVGGHTAPPLQYPLYQPWGMDSLCAFCPITSLVEATTTTTTNTTAATGGGRGGGGAPRWQHEESEARTSLASTSHSTHRQRSQLDGLSARATPPTPQECPSASGSSSPFSATQQRRSSTRMHVSLHEGPVMLTRPLSPSTGRHTPSSPAYAAPPPPLPPQQQQHFHADPTPVIHGTTGVGVARHFTTMSPTGVSPAHLPAFPAVGRHDSEEQAAGGVGTMQGSSHRTSAQLHSPPTLPEPRRSSSYPIAVGVPLVPAGLPGGSFATDPLSDRSSSSPVSSPPHGLFSGQPASTLQLLRDGRRTVPVPASVSATHHQQQQQQPFHRHPSSTLAGSGGGAFGGNLTFLPIEVQSAATVSPFFGAVGTTALHAHHSAASFAAAPADGVTTHGDAAPALSRCERGASAQLEESAPPSAATPTRVHPPWLTTSAAPSAGLVTAILAAPEVSWSSSLHMAGVGVGDGASPGGGGEDSSGASGSGDAMARGSSTDTRSPSTSASTLRAVSPAPWLQRVGVGAGGSGSGTDVLGLSGGTVHGAAYAGGWGGHAAPGSLGMEQAGVAGSHSGLHAHPGQGGFLHFPTSVAQSQLSCTPVPLDDSESVCVICLEGHQNADGTAREAPSSRATAAQPPTTPAPPPASEGIRGVKVGSQLLAMPCRHCCHQNCLQRWLLESTCCPMCRRDLTLDATTTL